MSTSTVERGQDAKVGYPLTVPEKPNGPAVRALLRRAGISGATLAAVAIAASALSKRPGTRALAVGTLAPGAGYVYTRSPLRFLATLGAFAASLVAWFGSGNIVLPPLLWVAAAFNARKQAARGRTTWNGARVAVPAALIGAAAAGTVARRRAFRAAQERGHVRAQYLATVPRIDPRPKDTVRNELSTDDLAVLRALLDRSLQPLGEFDGFTKIDQFQTSAIRYQLNFMQWALAMAQLHYAPSFHGYFSAAQRNLIDKLTLPPIWRYWAFEQTWGNLSLDWDPMKRDNIMLSGYLGTMLGAYESNTGDDSYRRSGALPFRLGKRTWPYTHDMVAAAVHDNMQRSGMTLFPCEPNWIYSACNMTGINTLAMSDRLHGTRFVESIGDRFRRRLREEFITPDGRVTAIRSARLGVTIPMLTSTIADCGLASMLHAFDPDLAQRCWAIARREFIDTTGPEPAIALRGWDAIDTGNYRKTHLGAFAPVMWAAAEMGDTELYQLLAASLDRQLPPAQAGGTRWYDELSTNMNAMLALARFNPPGGHRALIADGPGAAVLAGPVLEGASYPQVLVASTRTDGTDLHLVLRPGEGPTRAELGVERLVPRARYRLSGTLDDEVVADDRGRLAITVDVAGRTELALTPMP
ncbi:linalool dehydratase/isomerase domain-containing protein [Mycobacterium sp.]|uniref:linalool dehydratase/isomerase domain-containing protein n=1 Tax=Mycobacterium sp. TaxID=1785 RepID=UPI003F96F557